MQSKSINIINSLDLASKKYQMNIFFINSIDDIDNFIFSNIDKNTFKNILKKKNFDCEKESLELISFLNDEEENYIGVVGISNNIKKLDYESIKNNFGKILSFIQSKKISAVNIQLADSIFSFISFKLFSEILQVALLLKLYFFDDFISDIKNKIFTDFFIDIVIDKQIQENEDHGIKNGLIIGNSINFSRYLSDLPAKELFPLSFIEIVKKELANKNINAEVTIFDMQKLKEFGMGGIVGVGQGSNKDPYLMIIKYTPKDELKINKTIAIVGKGVTFDTGGISIKPSEGMEDMKSDMSGAAATVSSFIGLSQLNSPYTIYAITPLAENMVDGNSIRPGDILKFYNGKTAEIKNTDAEGRLILADALAYASVIIKPDIMIDLATLTGACRIALGPVYAGLMSENNALKNNIEKAGLITGDKCWALPLESAYEINMHSDVADICNIGTKGYKAGATMGGMFLREFVDPSIAWAHLDIATVATDCPFKSYMNSFGATGFGVNLLIELLSSNKYLQ